MSDKELIKNKFQKSLSSYSENAPVQKKMAHELMKQIQKKKYSSILEIGSYTGILTEKIIKNFEFNSYLALDIVNSFDFIKNLSPKIKFLQYQDILS